MNFDILRYSMVWEDIDILYQALDVRPHDDVLCITSAGDNVLGLLLKEPRTITAVDLNPCQNALLELKLAAIQTLEHAEFLALLGFTPAEDRVGLYKACSDRLSPGARDWWDSNGELIHSGICGGGRLERYFRHWHEVELPSLVDPGAISRCFDLDDVVAQQVFFNEYLDNAAFAEHFRWYFGEEMMASRGRTPAQFAYAEVDAGAHFYDRFLYAFTRLPLRGNFYLEWFLTGKYRSGRHLHPYLLAANYPRLKKLAGRVRIETAAVEELLTDRPAARFSKASLSNMFEYMSPVASQALLGRIHHLFRPGGRLAWWSLLADRSVPPALADRYQSHDAFAHRLWQGDRSWFYQRFHLAKVMAGVA